MLLAIAEPLWLPWAVPLLLPAATPEYECVPWP
jgi:hypothetical protein